MNLLLVLPLTASTLPAAQSLLTRMYAWEPLRNNSILIVRDFPLTEEQCKPVLKVAEEIFSGGRASGEVIRTPMILPDPSYPYTYNFLFETAIKHIALRRKCPFLWLDPHCVPVRKGWIQTLEAEYQACGKPFLGHILTPARHNTPYPIMAAPAVYPAQIPKIILQRLISKRQTAWELSCADVIVQNAFASKLIHSIPNNGKPMIFTRGTHPGTVDINTIPSDALLVHTTGYKSLIAAYAGETQVLPQAPVVKVAKEKPAGYYHSGNLGDIIYGLYAIKKAGGGKLYLGPKQLRTSPARSPIKQADYDRMAPLLSAQSYITSHAFSPRHPGTDNAFDMNIYRNKWDDREFRERAHISTLIQMQCHVLGVEEKFRQDEAWLTVPKPIQTGMFVCHRSERYRDKEFPWPKILEALKGRLLFIGLNSEHTQFCDEMDVSIPFWKCGDFLDMASIIAGSLGFIGNQSFPMSLALALNKPVIQEVWENSPDCLFVRQNFLRPPITEPRLQEWIHACEYGNLKSKSSMTPVSTNSYYHSGNLGDIIYALSALKHIGGCHLFIGPTQKNTSPAGNPIQLPQYKNLAPLLDCQPYILSHSFTAQYPATPMFDLNTFRNSWNDPDIRKQTGIELLAQMHCHVLGVAPKFSVDDVWLTVPKLTKTGLFIVHRSERYRDDTFPWAFVLEHFKGRMMFVGFPKEHEDFQATFKVQLAYWQPKDFLELASVIAGSLGFIGNQSFPCSIAIACGQRVLQETWGGSPDCLFPRANFLSQRTGSITEQTLLKWETSTHVK